MVLHLVADEKIINRTIEIFEKINKHGNKFLIEVPDKEYVLKYVAPSKNAYSAVYNTPEYWELVGDVEQYQAVIIHYLSYNKCLFINKFKNIKISFAWYIWGGDLYSYLAYKGYKLYLWKPSIFNLTVRNLYDDKMNTLVRSVIRKIFLKKTVVQVYEAAFKRIDYCCIFNKPDFYLLNKQYPANNSKWLWSGYYPIDQILGKELVGKHIEGNGIIVGNSGSITGNHVAAFDLLKSFSLQDRNVLVPLSYGNPDYIKLVIKKGNLLLPKNFVPLQTFMPLHEYNQILISSQIVIMFQLRQEAAGNLIISLYLGAKVYLHEENTLFEYFSSIGVKVFSIKKDLTIENRSALNGLSIEDQNNNRKILLEEFNEDRILLKTSELVKEITAR